MMKYVVGAWNSLSQKGRAYLAIVLVVVVGVLLSLTMYWRYDWTSLIEVLK